MEKIRTKIFFIYSNLDEMAFEYEEKDAFYLQTRFSIIKFEKDSENILISFSNGTKDKRIKFELKKLRKASFIGDVIPCESHDEALGYKEVSFKKKESK